MKYKKMFLSFLIIFNFVFLLNTISADVIPNNSHELDKCVKINMNDFDNNYSIIKEVKGPGVGENKSIIEKIDTNKCLSKGYKFNTIKLYAINKSYIKDKNISNLNLDNLIENKDVHQLDLEEYIYGGYIKNTNYEYKDVVKENVIYEVFKDSNNLNIYKKERSLISKNGKIKKEVYSKSDMKDKLNQEKASIFKKISNFFRNLFG